MKILIKTHIHHTFIAHFPIIPKDKTVEKVVFAISDITKTAFFYIDSCTFTCCELR